MTGAATRATVEPYECKGVFPLERRRREGSLRSASSVLLFLAVFATSFAGTASIQAAPGPAQTRGSFDRISGPSCEGNCAFCVGCIDGTVETCECCCEPSCVEAGDCCGDFGEMCADVDMRAILGIPERAIEPASGLWAADAPWPSEAVGDDATSASRAQGKPKDTVAQSTLKAQTRQVQSPGPSTPSTSTLSGRRPPSANRSQNKNPKDAGAATGTTARAPPAGGGRGASPPPLVYPASTSTTSPTATSPASPNSRSGVNVTTVESDGGSSAPSPGPGTGPTQLVQYITVTYRQGPGVKAKAGDGGSVGRPLPPKGNDGGSVTLELYGDGPSAPPEPSAPYPPHPPFPSPPPGAPVPPARPPGPAGPPGPPTLNAALQLQDWSWGSTVNFALPDSPGATGKAFSIGVAAKPYGGFAVGNPRGFPGEMEAISFCLKPGGERGYDLDIRFEDTEAGAAVDVADVSAAPGAGWRCYAVDIGDEVRRFIQEHAWDKISFQDRGRRSTFSLHSFELSVPPGWALDQAAAEDRDTVVENGGKKEEEEVEEEEEEDGAGESKGDPTPAEDVS